MTPLTDLNSKLTPGAKYLLYFDLPAMNVDTLRKLAASGDFLIAYEQRYINNEVKLLGTTVQENYDGKGKSQLIALVKIQGTPLLAAVAPVVAICLIVAGVYLAISFKHAIETTAASIAKTVDTGVTDITSGVNDLANEVGSGIADIGEGAGSGLKYALPILAVGISALAVTVFFGYVKAGG